MKKYRTITKEHVTKDSKLWDIEDARYKMISGFPYEELNDYQNDVVLYNPVETSHTKRCGHESHFSKAQVSEAFTKESHPEYFL